MSHWFNYRKGHNDLIWRHPADAQGNHLTLNILLSLLHNSIHFNLFCFLSKIFPFCRFIFRMETHFTHYFPFIFRPRPWRKQVARLARCGSVPIRAFKSNNYFIFSRRLCFQQKPRKPNNWILQQFLSIAVWRCCSFCLQFAEKKLVFKWLWRWIIDESIEIPV